MTRLHAPIRLRWNDLDAYGHVNNAAMLVLLEEARIEAFWGASERSAIDDPSTLWLVARQEVEYLLPIPYQGAPLDVQLWLGRLGGASLDVCYEVRSPAGVEPSVEYARAASTIVLVDAGTQRPRRISPEEREAWGAFVEEPVVFTKRPA